MYLLIFMPKNFVVTNWPTSPYHDGQRVQARVGAERAREVLVHADRDAEIVIAEPDRVRRPGSSALAAVAHPLYTSVNGMPGEPQQRHDRVRVVDLVAAAERELDVAPLDPRVGERAPDRDRAHLDAGHPREAAERMQSDSDDRDVRFMSLSRAGSARWLSPPVGRRRSRPRCRRRRCGTGPSTSSISMPRCSTSGSDFGEARLDLHLVGEFDVADTEGNEVAARRSRVRRRRRWEFLGRPRPEPAPPRQQVFGHLGRRAARARVLRGKGDDPALGTPAPDQLRGIARDR